MRRRRRTLRGTELLLSELDLEPSGADTRMARMVLDTTCQVARRRPKAVYGRKLFLSALRDSLAKQSKYLGEPRRFARIVTELHQKGLVTLHRADLVQAMDRKLVDDSQIDLKERRSDFSALATFNFIEIPKGCK